ncbi:hypothetical protein [Clostridioides difficile]|uniref:hypothetical protein n=1 Tax=Clostridioides difficile TaxID=1496 RepID=UPI000F614CB2|nr:hypothetical protein [Clostridioides difficile]MCJ0310336.1 hypothetical protein [Clostridioides difficile]MCJ0377610.1 hypothetical protein [Clostridioides difficile]MCJ0410823.1 hypothetical protein [Clostridioides difficile]MCO8703371.1 hypothetical protein [Clostridioides difficile]MDB0411036.1 hypothetical protein [Clostridioides difficile]
MKLNKKFKTVLSKLTLSFVLFIFLTPINGTTVNALDNKETINRLDNYAIGYEKHYNITIESKKVNGVKQVCGYVTDLNGNPVANKTVFIGFYDSPISYDAEKLYTHDTFYDEVKTNSSGYYTTNAYYTGYYYEVFVPFKTLTKNEVESFLFSGGEWPSRIVFDAGNYYACNDYKYVYVSRV